jgi:hypothetical protein
MQVFSIANLGDFEGRIVNISVPIPSTFNNLSFKRSSMSYRPYVPVTACQRRPQQ